MGCLGWPAPCGGCSRLAAPAPVCLSVCLSVDVCIAVRHHQLLRNHSFLNSTAGTITLGPSLKAAPTPTRHPPAARPACPHTQNRTQTHTRAHACTHERTNALKEFLAKKTGMALTLRTLFALSSELVTLIGFAEFCVELAGFSSLLNPSAQSRTPAPWALALPS